MSSHDTFIKREQLKSILLDLSRSPEELCDEEEIAKIYGRLEEIYLSNNSDEKFRHYYSEIFSIIVNIKRHPEIGDLNNLLWNIQIIHNGYQKLTDSAQGTEDYEKLSKVNDSIRKLFDHVNLEIARLSYIESLDIDVSGESAVVDLNSKITSLEDKTSKVSEDLNSTATKVTKDFEGRIQRIQKEHVAILGIFASVVFAVTAGLTFSSSVLNNINAVSAYRLIIIALVIGIVLVNVLFGLFYYLDRIVYGRFDNKLMSESVEKLSIWGQIKTLFKGRATLKPLVLSNLVLVGLLALSLNAWDNGLIEQRNERVDNEKSVLVQKVEDPIQQQTES